MSTPPLSTTITNEGPFLVTMEHENLCVITIPTVSIPNYAWWLIREHSLDCRRKKSFYSVLMDDDGLSLICSVSSASTLEMICAKNISISPQKWRAFVINVVGSAAEFPGAVHYLADSLSNAGLSILHISTFEYEVFLVQEQDISKACEVFRVRGTPLKFASVVREAQRKRTLSSNSLSAIVEASADRDGSSYSETHLPLEPPVVCSFKEGFQLCVLPGHVMLARLNEDRPLADCSNILTKLMLFDERYSVLERLVSKGDVSSKTKVGATSGGSTLGSISTSITGSDPNTSAGTRSASRSRSDSIIINETMSGDFTSGDESRRDLEKQMEPYGKSTYMWGMWQCENELTFLIDESDVDRFPEGSLNVSPQRWRLIKLEGRMIEFDETGVVSAMSKIDPSIPSLNISTATTNYTLVPEELLEQTLDCLSNSLKCPVKEYR